MSNMRNRVAIPLLTVAFLAAAVWGFSQYQTKRQWEISAENQYQRAFEEMATNANNMEADLSKALVAGSFQQTINLLTNTWREANTCQSNLGQLPLTSMELAGTKNLLANVSAYCFNTSQTRLVTGKDLNENQWKNLRILRNRVRLMSRHLGQMQQNFFNSRSRWLEVGQVGTMGAAGISNNMSNNKVTKSFLMLEDGLKRVPDAHYEGNNQDFVPKPTGLTGPNVTIKEAERIFRDFLRPDYPNAQVRYERIIRGGFPSYMLRAVLPNQPKRDLRGSVSMKGGHIAWMLGTRDVNRTSVDLPQCQKNAVNFLKTKGFSDMKVVASETYDNIATLTCAPERGGAIYYPELVKVQVAQDNGNILGCDFIPYLTFHDPKAKGTPKPAYGETKIRGELNPHFKPEKFVLAQVLDEMFNKVLCYEVSGKQGADRYLLYYNAATGKEEKIRRVDKLGNEII